MVFFEILKELFLSYNFFVGWSIPSTKAAAQNLSIPVPVNCRPLIENASPSLKVYICLNGF